MHLPLNYSLTLDSFPDKLVTELFWLRTSANLQQKPPKDGSPSGE
ncbi:hypothetical protein [Calothrix sp. NIES-3974]|nr:hypothetical protein [Calothrix sp. NIES-3974]